MSNWYRDPKRGRIAGVCAGLANRLGWEPWAVRLVVVLLAVMWMGAPMVLLYLAAWFFLEPMPTGMAATTGRGPLVTPPSGDRLATRFDELELRLQRLEKWMTSSEYRLNRDLKRMQ